MSTLVHIHLLSSIKAALLTDRSFPDIKKEVRRVTVLHRAVTNLPDSEGIFLVTGDLNKQTNYFPKYIQTSVYDSSRGHSLCVNAR